MNQHQYRIKKCSIADKGAYAHVVGNGTADDARSNAHTLDWEGNAWYQGDVYVGSTSGTNKDEGSKKLATEEYVNEALAGFEGNGVSYVAQDTAPEDIDVLWVDTADNTEVEIGANDLVVTVQYVDGVYSLVDITYDEIVEAIDDGRNARVEWTNNEVRKIYYLTYDRSKNSANPYLLFSYNYQTTIDDIVIYATGKIERWAGNMVSTARKINNKTLASDITLTAADVGAIATVNGMAPDESGNVEIESESGCSVTVDDETMMVSSGGVNSYIEEKFELIDTLILEEDTAVKQTVEPDGTPYKLKVVYVRMTSTASNLTGQNVVFQHNNTKIGATWVSSFSNNTATKCCDALIEQDRGYWRSMFSAWATDPGYGTLQYNRTTHRLGQNIEEHPYVTQIRLNGTIPAGTTIEIWGVRA